jgi:hypothetical protein
MLVAAQGWAKGGIDRSFGRNGLVDATTRLHGHAEAIAWHMAGGPAGSIYILNSAINGCPQASCVANLYLIRRHANGSLDREYARGRGALAFSGVGGVGENAVLAVDGRGRPLVAYADDGGLHIVRLLANGSVDRSFGVNARALIPCDCEGAALALRIDGKGRVTLVASQLELTSEFPAKPASQQHLLIARLTPSGNPDSRFGLGGMASTFLTEADGPPQQVLAREDGSILVSGPYGCCSSEEGIYLLRVAPNGAIDTGFVARSRAALSGLHKPMATRPNYVSAIIARRHGAVDVLGSTERGGFVLRFARGGGLDQSFGMGGFRPVRWQIRAAVRAQGGRVFAAGDEVGEEGALAFGLLSSGKIDSSFAGGLPIKLKAWSSLGLTTVMQRHSRPLLFEPGIRGCREYCPPEPKLMRFTRLGPRASRVG